MLYCCEEKNISTYKSFLFEAFIFYVVLEYKKLWLGISALK